MQLVSNKYSANFIMSKKLFQISSIEEVDENMGNYDIMSKYKQNIVDSPVLSKANNKSDIFARFQIGSSCVDIPTTVNENGNGAVPTGLRQIDTEASLRTVSTYTSLAGYNGLEMTMSRQDGSRKSFRPNAVRKLRRRAVFKNGDCNILQSRISKRRLRYLQDIFTTLVDSQWRWTLTIFAIGFLGSWLIFALIWWLIAFTHGDLEQDHLPSQQEDSNWTPCVLNIHGFTSCFLFSIETQHTIGYGVRTTTEECPEAIFIMCLQSIAGMIIQAFMVGIVFAKMTRPKLRTQTLQFSRNAVICQRDGQLCLIFRVGDMRKSHIIGASIRAQLIRNKKTKEGEILSNFQTELLVNADGCDGNLFFIWPMTIVHKIDEESPFYRLSASDLLQEKFEIVVILEDAETALIMQNPQEFQLRAPPKPIPKTGVFGPRTTPEVNTDETRPFPTDYL
ncbi:G protein-activated inward rectifier potassium channel 3-like isoform X2 [Rhynchophorus ferrugineus]|uniref:G protein-activated inward rectifier potassium channel 3-like isoform X2 n=1 Tax=Rhynchophorus ferrugineus TaxID=354439 RepID=UPI003FCDDCA1